MSHPTSLRAAARSVRVRHLFATPGDRQDRRALTWRAGAIDIVRAQAASATLAGTAVDECPADACVGGVREIGDRPPIERVRPGHVVGMKRGIVQP